MNSRKKKKTRRVRLFRWLECQYSFPETIAMFLTLEQPGKEWFRVTIYKRRVLEN